MAPEKGAFREPASEISHQMGKYPVWPTANNQHTRTYRGSTLSKLASILKTTSLRSREGFFLGRHIDPSLSKGDIQIRTEIGLLPAGRDIDSSHNLSDVGLTLLTSTPYVLLKKSASSGPCTRTP